MLMMLACLASCWNLPQLMLMMLAVLVLMMERAAADAHDACWSVFVPAVDAHDARCIGNVR